MRGLVSLFSLAILIGSAKAATTINSTNNRAYGANIGWVNWTGDTNNGAVIGEYVCSGYIYAANAGWINLGSGNPTNGIYYQNQSANDFGVNQDGLGNLRGYAWGANIGWINFENLGAPAVDLKSGVITGFVYSANCGWIGLSNSFARVQTDQILPGQLDANGLPLAWELQNFGATGIDPNADPDHDGMSNKQEYLAGTNPNDATDKLAIASTTLPSAGASVSLSWKSVPSRYYLIQKTLDVSPPAWTDSGLGLIASDGTFTTRTFVDAATPERFYRVQAVRPLQP